MRQLHFMAEMVGGIAELYKLIMGLVSVSALHTLAESGDTLPCGIIGHTTRLLNLAILLIRYDESTGT